MTRIVNGILIIEPEPDGKCECCGKMDELRPYGKNGAHVCFDCMNKPENKPDMEAALDKLFNKLKPVNFKNN